MSLITRCPACQTLFRVVPDQLRISDGWVRCGQCQEAFDASCQLVQPASVAPLPEPINLDPPSSLTLPPVEYADVDESPAAEWGIEPANQLSFTSLAEPEALVSIDPHDLVDPDRMPVEELREPSFLLERHSAKVGPRPSLRILLLGLCVTLLMALIGQVVLHERDRIVAMQPGLKSWFVLFCRPLNCVVSPVQQKDAVLIDGASFSKTKPDTYRLNFTLKNTSTMALAVPAVELTLTDSLDQAVVRRVFLAAELGNQSDKLAAASEWTTSITMVVKTAGMAERIVGYRLLAYYP